VIQFIKSHKAGVAITCATIIIAAAFAAMLVSSRVTEQSTEEVHAGRVHDAGVFGEDVVVHDSTEGEIIIRAARADEDKVESVDAESVDPSGVSVAPAASAAAPKLTESPDMIWNVDTYAGNHTPVPKAQMADGSLGVLTIPALGLSVNVYESADNNVAAMSKGIAHFPSSSAWDGNVSMSAHNINYDGSDGYFKYLYTLEKGSAITYMTALGERAYTVESVTTIAASDWSPLGYTDDHRLTLITCISGQPDKRLCVQAVMAQA
jgi:LPXTG-site transpeptidase (sortase) family protein